MEIRVLRYFLAVAREESLTHAAESLHITQPTLTRQMQELEEELGKKLFIREPRSVRLTKEGMLLRQRANEICTLADRASEEIRGAQEEISGDIFIGAGETLAVHTITRLAAKIRDIYPGIHIHISSGDTVDILDKLENGLLDFGLLYEPIDHTKFDFYPIDYHDRWGLLMRSDDPLTQKAAITPSDLQDLPLIVSRHADNADSFSHWLSSPTHSLHINATYSLLYNGSLMVEDGLGYALCFDGIIDTREGSRFSFRPLSPELTITPGLFWKKYRLFSPAAEYFLKELLKK